MTRTPYDQVAARFSAARDRLLPNEARYLSLVLAPLSPGSLVLDLGCGTGHPIGSRVAAEGHRLVGVDASAAMLAIARERLPGQRWIHARMEEVELEDTFAAVICWDSLFHLPRHSFPTMIRRIHGWLEEGGRVMISSGGVVEEGDGFTDLMFGEEFYYDSLSPAQMIQSIEETGLRVVVAEMCDLPDGGRNKGKWATVAERPRGDG